MLTCIFRALLATSCLGQGLGSWTMIPAKSRQSSRGAVEAATAKYEAPSGAEIWTFDELRTNGRSPPRAKLSVLMGRNTRAETWGWPPTASK